MSRLWRAMARGGSAGALPGLEIALPGAAYILDDRSARDGRLGGTLAGNFVAVPGLGGTPDRVFYFTQADASGTQRGHFPVDAYPALAGFAPIPVPLANGILDRDQVATAMASVLGAYYTSSSTAAGGIARVYDAGIDNALALVGDLWPTRGSAGAWGMQRVDGGNAYFEQVDTTVTYGAGPVFTNTAYLRGTERIPTAPLVKNSVP